MMNLGEEFSKAVARGLGYRVARGIPPWAFVAGALIFLLLAVLGR